MHIYSTVLMLTLNINSKSDMGFIPVCRISGSKSILFEIW